MELIISLSIICIAILLLMQYFRQPLAAPERLSGREYKYHWFFVFAFSTALVFVSAFREGFVDTRIYKGLYELVGTDFDNAFNDTLPIDDYGFSLFMVLLNRINPDPQFLIIVTSVVTLGSYMYTIGRYSRDVPFSLLLFLCVAYFGTMNGIRQVMAGAVLILALPWLRDRKLIPYILLTLLMSTFHASLLVMIPLSLVISGKRMNWGVLLFAVLIVLCFIAPNTAYNIMGAILEDSAYADYLDNETKMGMMRFLVALVPAALAVLYCWIQRDNRDGEDPTNPNYASQRLTDTLINMQIVSFGFTTLGLRMVYFARIGMYFSCVLPLLLPITINGIFTEKSAVYVKRIAIVLYLIFFAYQAYSYDSYGYFFDFYLNI